MSNLINQIRNSRRSSEGLPFELSLDAIDSDLKAIRTEDKTLTREYNKEITDWTQKRDTDLRGSVSRMIRNDIGLSDSIKGKVYFNRKGGKEAQRVGFSFLREGIYIHKGAGRGKGGLIGGSWLDRHGVKKSRAPESAGKMNSGNRQSIDWFDKAVEKKLPQLADIVGNYSATLQVNATKIYIDR